MILAIWEPEFRDFGDLGARLFVILAAWRQDFRDFGGPGTQLS